MSQNLKRITGINYLFLGDFRFKNSTVATKTRHPRPETGPFQGFSILYFWIRRQDMKINKGQLFSTS